MFLVYNSNAEIILFVSVIGSYSVVRKFITVVWRVTNPRIIRYLNTNTPSAGQFEGVRAPGGSGFDHGAWVLVDHRRKLTNRKEVKRLFRRLCWLRLAAETD